jgi:hypothetical protein
MFFRKKELNLEVLGAYPSNMNPEKAQPWHEVIVAQVPSRFKVLEKAERIILT